MNLESLHWKWTGEKKRILRKSNIQISNLFRCQWKWMMVLNRIHKKNPLKRTYSEQWIVNSKHRSQLVFVWPEMQMKKNIQFSSVSRDRERKQKWWKFKLIVELSDDYYEKPKQNLSSGNMIMNWIEFDREYERHWVLSMCVCVQWTRDWKYKIEFLKIEQKTHRIIDHIAESRM